MLPGATELILSPSTAQEGEIRRTERASAFGGAVAGRCLIPGDIVRQFQNSVFIHDVGEHINPVHTHCHVGDGVGGGDDTVAAFLLK